MAKITEHTQLTAKQEKFVQEYLVDLNATQAAIRAGYSKKTATIIGFENLSKPNISYMIQKRREKLAEKVEITQERVLQEYAKLAFLDPQEFYDKNGGLLSIPDLPKDVAAALSGMDVMTSFNKDSESVDTIKKIKFSDKKAALDSVAKHLGMFSDKAEQGLTLAATQAILSLLPKEYSDAWKKALTE